MLPFLILLLRQEAGEGPQARIVDLLSLERPGTHHGVLTVRLRGEGDAPVSGASVSLHSRAPGWGGAEVLVAAGESDAEGHVRFLDVNSDHLFECRVVPDPSLRRCVLPVPPVSAGECDLGEVRLQPNLVLAGTVEIVEPDGTARPASEGVVNLRRADEGRRLLAFFPLSDGTFVLENFDVAPARLEVETTVAGKRRTYGEAFEIDPARRARRLALRVPVADTSERPGLLLDELEPGPFARPERRWSGRVVLPDGSPAAGLPIVAFGRSISDRVFGAGEIAWTDADGRFEVVSHNPLLDRLRIETPGGQVWVVSQPPAKEDWLHGRTFLVKDPAGFEARLEEVSRSGLRIEGFDREKVGLSWLSGGEWRPCTEKVATLVVAREGSYRSIRASAPGHLSRSWYGPSRDGDMAFSFRGDVPHEVLVRDPGGPLPGARIDVVEESPWRRGAFATVGYEAMRRLLDRRTADEKGRLEVLADPGAVYRVHVYADGHEPAYLRLRPGRNEVVLAPCDATVALHGFPAEAALRIKPAGREALVAYLGWSEEGSRREVRLAPGKYDVSVQAADGSMVGGTTFEATAGKLREVDLAKDGRPRVVVRVPPLPPVPERFRRRPKGLPGDPSVDRWQAWATRRTPPGGSVGAAAMSSMGNRSSAEPCAAVEAPSDDVRILRLSGTGRFRIHLGARRGSLGHSLFREVEVGAGESLELEVPPLAATMGGTMAKFMSDVGFSHHGVAGPRLLLLPAAGSERPTSWGVVCDLPPRVKGERDGRFEIPHLPSGPAILFHHLAGEARWGGVPVDLVRGERTEVGELSDLLGRDLQVTVLDADGRPARDAVLRVRDRMSEAWRAFTEIPTTGVYASDPIPLPPAARLEGAPVVLPSVRAGWLELEVETDSGRTVAWLRGVDPQGGLTLRLPR